MENNRMGTGHRNTYIYTGTSGPTKYQLNYIFTQLFNNYPSSWL